MNKENSWKIILVVFLVVICLLSIIPPEQKLKPGIDLAGGATLLYQINTENMSDIEKRNVAQDMIRVLQQRVDPANQMNLVWRPHGNDRIEIQMPLATKETRELRRQYQEKINEILDRNLSLRNVQQALTVPADMPLDEYRQRRDERFTQMAGDSEAHQKLLNELAEAQDALLEAMNKRDDALTTMADLEEKLAEMDISKNAYENLDLEWENLDDPNKTARLERIAPEKPQARQLIRDHVQAALRLRDARQQIYEPETGLIDQRDEILYRIEARNVSEDMLERILGAKGDRGEQLEEFKKNHPEIDEQTIDELVAAHDAYSEVAGRLDDPQDLIEKLKGSGVLEFRILPLAGDPSPTQGEITRYVERLQQLGPQKASDERYVWIKIMNPEAFDVQNCYRVAVGDEEFVLASNQPGEIMLHETGEEAWRLQNAYPDTDEIGNPAVAFGFNARGASRFWNLTKENINRPLCIVLDDEAISAPNIRTAISSRGTITGRFSEREVLDLVDKLNAGSLPARLSDQPLSVNTIGPTLGHDNLVSGLKAGIIGLVVVAIFMLIYYLVAGSLADIALFMNLLLIIGVMAFMQATFTLPGIAGLILTIGMAVDANVLIFERIREEQSRGSSLRMSVKNGYDRAFRTILDANITTFAVALILYWLASEEIKGFALILMIGIVSSMFTALFVTRLIFELLMDAKILTQRIKMMQLFGKPDINWMSLRPVFWIFSICIVILGWFIVINRGQEIFSIEFRGGTSIHAVLTPEGADDLLTEEEKANNVTLREEVEDAIHQIGRDMNNSHIAAARVQRVGEAQRLEFEIVTTETNIVEINIDLGDNTDLTAEEIQNRIRQAAIQLGDRRMEEAVVTAQKEAGDFLVTTRQTNINEAQEAISKALPVTAEILPPQNNQKTAADVQKLIRNRADNLGNSLLERTTVKEGDGGKFILTTPYTNLMTVEEIVTDEDILPGAEIAYTSTLNMTATTNPVVTNAVLEALSGKLDILTNLHPELVETEPVDEALISRKPYLDEYLGGVFLHFHFGENTSETFARIKKRFNQSQFKSEFVNTYGTNDYQFFPPNNTTLTDDEIVKSIEIAVVSPDITYGESTQDEWEQFVKNEQNRFQAVFEWTTSLPRVTQIDPSIGHKSMNEAMIAIVVSLLAIVAYIWIRFGNWNFGVAAVMALFHDVSIALGLVALTGIVAGSPLGQFLKIRDFKIDLPMIAAFLTVIGYSLNDTIVVFDRIRENRGKMALLSLDTLNHSINQTISRTVLTSVTTMMVLIIMYIWGGEGLRSFNFVLIIGVLFGTYSSIGIASPALTLLQSRENNTKK